MKLKPPPVRQPPPPPRRHSGGSSIDRMKDSQMNIIPTTKRNEEVNSVIDVPKIPVKVKKGRSRPYYLRRSKRLNLLNMSLNSLPDEIVSEILVRIPAQDIYCAVMAVCLKWYQMIHTHKFVKTHLQRSTNGLLIQKRDPLKTQLTFMELSRQGRIELTRLNYEPGYEIWCSSCNGLILESERNNHYALYITNPVTMQHFSLPPSLPFFGLGFFYTALAYASLSMEYKVVRVYYEENQCYCAILTVGVDESWRPVHTQHLSLKAKELLQFRTLPTEGFVHWAERGSYVLTLNVETEIITEYLAPPLCSSDGLGYCNFYFSTAKYLSLLITRCLGWSWEVWEMKPETGEWTKLLEIDLKDRKCEIIGWLCKSVRMFKSVGYNDSWLTPVGWLEYKGVLVYRVNCRLWFEESSICIACNIQSKEIEFIELDSKRIDFFVHRNSLLWLDGC